MDTSPFPGLRPFRTEERELFFGREGQSEVILDRLRDNRLVVLVGPSGSGKSSLINAGVLPNIRGGFLTSASSHWRIAKCRPGSPRNDPIANLAAALCEPEALRPLDHEKAHDRANEIALMEVTLRGSSLGLVDSVRLARLPEHEQVIVIIDQFEELFRFGNVSEPSAHADDTALFVKLILEATRQREVPIYLVLGLRSDYIGDCARYRDLPEAVMAAMYLIPRLTRDQIRAAIEGPVRLRDARIAPRLVNRLLNDVGDNPDQLPILQHAMMRTWELWRAKDEATRPIDLDEYNAIGGMANALSIHADETYGELPDESSKLIARLAFQCLSGRDVNSRDVRHPTSLGSIAAVAGVDTRAAIAVIDHFRRPDRAFLTPQWPAEIQESSIIDVSHESLIRGWATLRKWVDAEAEDATIYTRLADAAAQHAQGKQDLWGDPQLQLALDWRERRKPNKAWAKRYDPGFDQTIRFLDCSRDARDARRNAEEKRRQRELNFQRRIAVGAVALATVIAILGIFAFVKKRETDAALLDAMTNKDLYLASLADQWI